MNKLKLASIITVLLAGASAMPAMAQSAGGEQSWQGNRGVEQSDKGRHREVPDGNDRGGNRDNRDYRGDRGDRGDDRQDRRDDRRDDRSDWRDDRRDDRRDWRENGSTYAERRDDRRDWRDDRRDDRNDWRDDRRDDRWDNNRWDNRNDGRRDHYVRHNDRRWSGYNWYPQYRYRAPVRYVYPRGYRAYQWRVGYRLPSSYYAPSYYVNYNSYGLPPPPYGYRWVRVDRDVVLVAIASGLIRDVLYGLYY